MTERPQRIDARLRERADRAGRWAQDRVPGATAVVESLERERMAAAGLVAGGLAYRLFLWLVPFGLVVAAALSFWVREDRSGLEEAARNVGLGAVAARSAAEAIAADSHGRWYFLVIGSALLVWFSMGAVRALYVAHWLAWGERPERLRRPHVAGLAFTGIATGVIAAGTAAAWLREELGVSWLLVSLLLVFLYAAVALWAAVRLPHAGAPWQDLVPGAILIGVGVQVVQLVVVLYLAPKLGRSSELYGSLGAATVILFWLYITARLVVAAAFLNAALWQRKVALSRERGAQA